ncbi:MAG: glycosyl hydrolase [Bacteroidales bacterium]|nr:glycosyl hydrolase [Bacteroidales bacterium]
MMKNLSTRISTTLFFSLLLIIPQLLSAQNDLRSLEEGFKNPPESAKPRTWWHWTNSNITKEGITKDLEWMKRVGIGGMQLADVSSGQGQTVKDKILFGSPEWLDAVRHAAAEAQRLNLEMTIFSSAGWSLTGGPWVKPEQAMKKLVWSEINVKGPKNFDGTLPMPPSVEGPFWNLSRSAQSSGKEPSFYKDFTVLAFPTPGYELESEKFQPLVTTSTGNINTVNLLDNNLNTSSTISASKDTKKAWIQFSFDRPFEAQAITLASRNGIPFGTLQVSNDENFRTIAMFPGPQLYRAGKVETVAFPETVAKFYRLEITGAPWKPAEVMSESKPKPDSVYTFSEILLHTGGRVNRWEDKAGFFHLFDYGPTASPDVASGSTIDSKGIIDLTAMLGPDGTLNWAIPEGNWTIMRFGYSLTGSKNRPAVPSGLGYEVDKLSSEHTLAYIKGYIDPIAGALGPLYGTGLRYVLLDSWEAGMQNWTDKMLTEFSKRRRYDPTPFLPVLTGRVVGNSDISDRFLWDFRRTLADMFAENHFSVVTDYMRKSGIGTYGEVSGVSLEILEDALLSKKYVDIPMGEFWFRSLHPELMYYQDIRGAASASHVYGKTLVAAESFTGGNFESPYSLKKIGDYWFAQGVNRIVFHTSAHQPLDTKPGNTMVGTHINRNITWAEQASPFMTYLARNSFMLQQGRFVADIAYLLNEGAPSTMPIWGSGLDPAPPEGYDYDYVNADVLINRMSVDSNGRLILPDGMSYAVLVLPNTDQMTLPVLQKIHNLVSGGATVMGRKPVKTPGLTGYPDSESRLQAMVFDLWGDLDGISRTQRSFGKGKVIWGMPLSKILSLSGVSRDVEYSAPLDTKLSWIHRSTGEADIYFIANGTDSLLNIELRFRVGGREAEAWDPGSGSIEPAGYRFENNKTIVPLHLSERQSVFVVFRQKALSASRTIPTESSHLLASLPGPWEIIFPPDMGAPEKIQINNLESWTLSNDEGVKYFSGTANYVKIFDAPKKWFQSGSEFTMDMGKVGDIAEVTLNGTPLGTFWKAPYQVDITNVLKKGENRLEIKVTNQWTNRLLGDMKAAPGKKVLNSTLRVFPGQKMNDSGLLGPVTIVMKHPI